MMMMMMMNTQTTCPNRITPRSRKGERPSGIRDLARVFEKSTTEFKLKQILLKCKSIIQIATFKVGYLYRKGQLSELTAPVIYHNIETICMQEHVYLIAKI